ncbi:MAG: hypothetical protein ACMUIP_13700 [bacterium]
MDNNYHTFFIPVMGTGHSADTPIRMAPFGISSVISLVDDILLEDIRKYYCEMYGLPYSKIGRDVEDGRAKRITAYLDIVQSIVKIKLEAMKNQPFCQNNDKMKYFDLLPDEHELKKEYTLFLTMHNGPEKDRVAEELTRRMRAGSIDVNIMVKLDRINFSQNGTPLGDEFTDAKAALRGYAKSQLSSSIIFSAGINRRLFNYLTSFPDFYRDSTGIIKKKITLKVSDFRSAFIQGKFLAKKGLEVYEYRIESGLNCGGHLFPTDGTMLPIILEEFRDKREQLDMEFLPLIQKYYKNKGWEFPESDLKSRPLFTVQGGIGTYGEMRRLREDYGVNMAGWCSPFLLVPEATCVDTSTRELLMKAGEDDLYISDVSPICFPFNNVRKTGSEMWTRRMIEEGKPGSQCVKNFLVSNTEFTTKPICLASRKYQKNKIEEINKRAIPEKEKESLRLKVVEKTCICDHLGNGALIALGLAREEDAPQAICPGPNIAWFDRKYTLKEMVDHIYGRGACLVPPERPHMFAKEISMYIDYFEKLIKDCSFNHDEIEALRAFRVNLEKSMDVCCAIAQKEPFEGENLASIRYCINKQSVRLKSICREFEKRIKKNKEEEG